MDDFLDRVKNGISRCYTQGGQTLYSRQSSSDQDGHDSYVNSMLGEGVVDETKQERKYDFEGEKFKFARDQKITNYGLSGFLDGHLNSFLPSCAANLQCQFCKASAEKAWEIFQCLSHSFNIWINQVSVASSSTVNALIAEVESSKSMTIGHFKIAVVVEAFKRKFRQKCVSLPRVWHSQLPSIQEIVDEMKPTMNKSDLVGAFDRLLMKLKGFEKHSNNIGRAARCVETAAVSGSWVERQKCLDALLREKQEEKEKDKQKDKEKDTSLDVIKAARIEDASYVASVDEIFLYYASVVCGRAQVDHLLAELHTGNDVQDILASLFADDDEHLKQLFLANYNAKLPVCVFESEYGKAASRKCDVYRGKYADLGDLLKVRLRLVAELASYFQGYDDDSDETTFACNAKSLAAEIFWKSHFFRIRCEDALRVCTVLVRNYTFGKQVTFNPQAVSYDVALVVCGFWSRHFDTYFDACTKFPSLRDEEFINFDLLKGNPTIDAVVALALQNESLLTDVDIHTLSQRVKDVLKKNATLTQGDRTDEHGAFRIQRKFVELLHSDFVMSLERKKPISSVRVANINSCQPNYKEALDHFKLDRVEAAATRYFSSQCAIKADNVESLVSNLVARLNPTTPTSPSKHKRTPSRGGSSSKQPRGEEA
jgi:hypothetical protein